MRSKITPRGLGLQSTAKGSACLFFGLGPAPCRCRLHCAPLRSGNHLMPLIERYFAGKTAAISGAGDGIGRALSQRLNAAGCHLWLSDINPETLAETCASLDDARGRVTSQIVDCGQRDALFSWAEAVGADTSSQTEKDRTGRTATCKRELYVFNGLPTDFRFARARWRRTCADRSPPFQNAPKHS